MRRSSRLCARRVGARARKQSLRSWIGSERSATCCLMGRGTGSRLDRKSTRLNSSHSQISYAVFCLKKKKKLNPSRILPLHLSVPLTLLSSLPPTLPCIHASYSKLLHVLMYTLSVVVLRHSYCPTG